ncbi:MAG: hypothetical protein K6G55_09430 [Selenomonadaceae bacterium]|nr:hypothetical protein [Selenomonadaceae bacterium]
MNALSKIVLSVLTMLLMTSTSVSANIYPETLENGKLILVDGGMGVGRYADKTSVMSEKYAPPDYQLAINIISVEFSEDYWREHETYVGSPYTVYNEITLRFRYNWDDKIIFYQQEGKWLEWNLNRDYSHAEGNPLIPNAAEVAFVTAYNMKFFGDKKNSDNYPVIDEYLYNRLGI